MRPDTAPLFGGHMLAKWVREGGPAERRIRGYLPRLWWHAFWFEQNWRTQVARLDNASLPEEPVFIVGLWRSGTTALHELLAGVTGWKTAQTWQCFNPSVCLLSQPPIDASATRPMDQVRVTTRSPQEDEFALLLLGEPSLYRAFIDPRRLSECAHQQWTDSDVSPLRRWQDFLRAITLGEPRERLLLKSPSHTFRLPLLRTLFPRARFIWIARDPGAVLPSNLKMWRAMIDRYSLWGCPSGTLESFLEGMLRACGAVLAQCFDDMPQENMLWVDFGELQSSPKMLVERAFRFLNPGSSPHSKAFESNLCRVLAQLPKNHQGSETPVHGNQAVETLRKIMSAGRHRFASP